MNGGVQIKGQGREWEDFDDVIFATHSDDSLSMLNDPSEHESAALGSVKYQPNSIVLHSDTSIMPKHKSVWSSWIYSEDVDKASPRIDLTCWMNELQPWLTEDPPFVTLNTTRDIDPALFARNAQDLMSLHDNDHGVPRNRARVWHGCVMSWRRRGCFRRSAF